MSSKNIAQLADVNPTLSASHEIVEILVQLLDHLSPRLDTYEQALYLRIFRLTVLSGTQEATIGLKSASKKMAFGVGAKGTRIAEGTIYEKLRALQSKRCIEVLDVTRSGTCVRIRLPAEIPGILPTLERVSPIDIETLDFFNTPDLRRAILEREQWKCFYCLRRLDDANSLLEHIVSRPGGNNTYMNLVGACRDCNNRKGTQAAEMHLRNIYRSGILNQGELEDRIQTLNETTCGRRKPILSLGFLCAEKRAGPDISSSSP